MVRVPGGPLQELRPERLGVAAGTSTEAGGRGSGSGGQGLMSWLSGG